MKKITILVDQLHSHGGIEKLVALKANYWSEVFGYRVAIVATEQKGQPIIYPLSGKVRFIDLSVNYNRGKSYFSPGNISRAVKNVVRLQSYIFREKPDFILVASHIPATYFLPFLACRAKMGKEFHFTKFERSQYKGLKAKIIDSIEARYDFLLVLSQEERTFYPSRNVVVIPNPVEIQAAEPLPVAEKDDIAVAVVRFAPVKQLEKMVAAWGLFAAGNPSWKLHVFGSASGDYFNKINQAVYSANLQESIIFKGQSDQIQSEIAKAKVLLMTSEQECFPMVILEANSVGVPVISFDCPTGPRNIIHHKQDGILVDYNNCGSFANALQAFAHDAGLQRFLSDNATKNAQRYAVSAVMDKWNDLIFNAND